jgi:hypothetical protein
MSDAVEQIVQTDLWAILRCETSETVLSSSAA